jgi:hypothetical protein
VSSKLTEENGSGLRLQGGFMKTFQKAGIAGVAMMALMTMSGCATKEETGTLAGAGVGAGVGTIVGNQVGSRAGGALVGGALGALVGNRMGASADKQDVTDAKVNALQQQANSQTVWITNSNGSKSSVTLSKGPMGNWVGPRGEYYENFPTEDQLKKAGYGF